MSAHGLRRGFVVFDNTSRRPSVSHTCLQPIADWLAADEDYLEHEGVFFEVCEQAGALMGAFIWRTNRGQGCGGIRSREYPSARDWLRDGLRLATGMGRKNALAGLFWGGAKGVVAESPANESPLTPHVREALFAAYGRFLTSLRGCYVAAEDSGVTVNDVDAVFSKTRHTTCISPSLGGSGNPSVITARGIVCAIKAAAQWMGETIQGKVVAVQGCGQVGLPLCRYLVAEGVRVVVSESSAQRAAEVGDELRQLGVELRTAPFGDNTILFEDAFCVSPNAWGGVLNKDTIPSIRAKVVCGACNNQLQFAADAGMLMQRGVIYVPDFVCNRMGVVNCSMEVYGNFPGDPLLEQHFDVSNPDSIPSTVKKVLSAAKEQGIDTNAAAVLMADQASRVAHPITGHRGALIIQWLVANGWAAGCNDPV